MSAPSFLSPFPVEVTRRLLVKSLADAEAKLRDAKERAADLAQIVFLAENERQQVIDALVELGDE